MYDRKHQEVQLRLKEVSNSESEPAAALTFLFLLIGFGGWEVRLESSQFELGMYVPLVLTSNSFILSSRVSSLPPVFSSRLYSSCALVPNDILKLRFAQRRRELLEMKRREGPRRKT